MGRTIPSFRLATLVEKDEWKEFHDRLGKSDKKLFDRMSPLNVPKTKGLPELRIRLENDEE